MVGGVCWAACTGAKPAPEGVAVESKADMGGERPAPAPADRTEAPDAKVRVRCAAAPRGVELTVENHGPDAISLRSTVTATDANGKVLAPLVLRDRCDLEAPPRCRTLRRGAAVRAPAWRGGQCDAARGAAEPVRGATFSVERCDGTVVAKVTDCAPAPSPSP